MPAAPKSDWREMDTAYLVSGAFLLAFGLMVVVVTWYVPVVIAAITSFFLGPGVVPLYYGWKARRTEEVLVDFTTRVRMYRRIGLDDLARLFGRTRPDIEKLLAQAIDRGLLNGVVDRASNEFVLRETFGQQVFVEKCPGCGERVGRWSFPEERFTCPYCEHSVLVPAAA